MSLHTPIRASITQISPGRWLLGSTIECRLVSERPSESYITAWKDGDMWYVITSASERPTSATPPNSNDLALVHEGGGKNLLYGPSEATHFARFITVGLPIYHQRMKPSNLSGKMRLMFLCLKFSILGLRVIAVS